MHYRVVLGISVFLDLDLASTTILTAPQKLISTAHYITINVIGLRMLSLVESRTHGELFSSVYVYLNKTYVGTLGWMRQVRATPPPTLNAARDRDQCG
jgi:hypothetical protein